MILLLLTNASSQTANDRDRSKASTAHILALVAYEDAAIQHGFSGYVERRR